MITRAPKGAPHGKSMTKLLQGRTITAVWGIPERNVWHMELDNGQFLEFKGLSYNCGPGWAQAPNPLPVKQPIIEKENLMNKWTIIDKDIVKCAVDASGMCWHGGISIAPDRVYDSPLTAAEALLKKINNEPRSDEELADLVEFAYHEGDDPREDVSRKFINLVQVLGKQFERLGGYTETVRMLKGLGCLK